MWEGGLLLQYGGEGGLGLICDSLSKNSTITPLVVTTLGICRHTIIIMLLTAPVNNTEDNEPSPVCAEINIMHVTPGWLTTFQW